MPTCPARRCTARSVATAREYLRRKFRSRSARSGLQPETRAIRGCVPKKLLVYGAHFAEDLDDARRFGWKIEGATFDWPTLRDNVLAEVTRLSGLYTQTLDESQSRNLRAARRHHWAARRPASASRDGDCRQILIATGARPHDPRIVPVASTASRRTRHFISTRCRGASSSRAAATSRTSSPASSTSSARR